MSFPPCRKGGGRGISERILCALVLSILLAYGCAGDGPPVASSSGEFDRLQAEIFNPHCMGAGCHNSQAQAGAMDLSPGLSYDDLVGVAPYNPVARAMGMLRVDPFDPANSFIIAKLRGPGAGQGTRMPQGMSPLPESDIAAIEEWIRSGAPRGSTAAPSASPTPVPPSPTDSATPTVTATGTETATAADTPTATPSVTGSVPSTSTASATPSPSPSPSPSPTPSASPTLSLFAQIQQTIFNPTCTDPFCHDSVGISGNLTLIEGDAYAELVGVEPDNRTARDLGLLRVDPGNPDNSLLLIKLEGPTDPFLGGQMPLGKDPLSAEQIQLVRDWIAAGATQ